MPLPASIGEVCGACLTSAPPFNATRCYGVYAGTLREAIHLLKFSGLKRLGRPLGALLAGLELPRADVIVPVPMSPRALRERGFNQTLILARAVGRASGMRVAMDVLVKTRETRPQIGLSARERAENLRGAFTSTGQLNGQRFLLLDDVVTTGATVRECSRTLRKAGASEITVIALARSPLA